ncbi:MAG TPA: heavy-metal-associated domain-containing protein [Candidatus Saccharimonadales bacterium]|nr:heavy-metal-associated domain-containing protein [Candidatus Saccharimonadales bacterium]
MKKITLQISGMHCTSCAMNIDGELEDTEGIKESNTNYAKQKTEVSYDPEKITEKKIIEIIQQVGYTAQNTLQ